VPSKTAAMRRPSVRLAVPHLRRPSRRVAAGALVVLAVLTPGWFWLRDSSLVRISDVEVIGATGPQAAEVRQALTDAAQRMSTLDVDTAKLTAAVRQFPIVAGVKVHPHLLHRLVVDVVQHVPVGALAHGSARLAVAGDGTILAGTLTSGLPLVPVSSPPGGRTLVEPAALRMVELLAAAPSALRARVTRVGMTKVGMIAHLSNGPDLFFGPNVRLAAKWAAATRVLSDYAARGASYLDLRVPERPAAGGLEAPPAATSSPATTASAPVNTQVEVQPPQ
jgi:cell division protein FtsQ